MLTPTQIKAMSDIEVLRKFKALAVEAADALWAIREKKPTKRPIIDINQDIYLLHLRYDAIITRLAKSGVLDVEKPIVQSAQPDLSDKKELP